MPRRPRRGISSIDDAKGLAMIIADSAFEIPLPNIRDRDDIGFCKAP